jgi:hypothetical protein
VKSVTLEEKSHFYLTQQLNLEDSTEVIPVTTAPCPAAGDYRDLNDLDSIDLSFTRRIRVLKRIPSGCRVCAAKKLAQLIDRVTKHNDLPSWARLFCFAKLFLRTPKRGGKNHSLSSQVNKIISEEPINDFIRKLSESSSSCVTTRGSSSKQQDINLESLSLSISGKLEEGDFKGAIRLACSEDTVAEYSEANFKILQEKHPDAHPDSLFERGSSEDSLPTPTVSADIVRKAILSFPNGSSGGPDGLRPQHLKDLIGFAAGDGAPPLVNALVRFIALVLEGKTPDPVQSYFFGGSLTALNKKDGGLRPIAVGCTLRRLVTKCACLYVRDSMADLLPPHQLGFGAPQGAECAVHAARIFLDNLSQHEALLKVDFRNAFNSIRRDKMMLAVCPKPSAIHQICLFPLIQNLLA